MRHPDWSSLTRELARWRATGLALPIWWRDDDAIAPTPALDRLTRLAETVQLALHLAVIPKPAGRALATYTAQAAVLVPLVHGWCHKNNAPEGAKKAEFGHLRQDAITEAEAGYARMKDLFGADMLPIFVPPWNRIDPRLLPRLKAAGFSGLSTFTPRSARLAAPGLVQINTHLDPIHWRAGGGLLSPDDLICQLVTLLRDRREGRADTSEPLGLLTHHLVHDTAIWDFTESCLSRLLDGGAVPVDLRQEPLP